MQNKVPEILQNQNFIQQALYEKNTSKYIYGNTTMISLLVSLLRAYFVA